ncbi:MAG: SMC-Scp complex subunit ScpB [Patescibacteria group bacterium]
MSSTPLPVRIEAYLFFRGGSVSLKEVEKALGASREQLLAALTELRTTLEGRGLALVQTNNAVALVTAPAVHEEIERLRKEELEGPLGRAGLETLAIVMYRGPLSRADIEYIRGVNVSTTLRTLQIRGLVERIDNPNDKRSFLYRVTTDTPAYLGVSRIEDLPEYAAVVAEVDAVLKERADLEKAEAATNEEL